MSSWALFRSRRIFSNELVEVTVATADECACWRWVASDADGPIPEVVVSVTSEADFVCAVCGLISLGK